MDYSEIFNKLKEIIQYSSSRYYHYSVAALLECSDGTMYPGVNIETSSPQAGTCAERCAMFSAMANGVSSKDFKKIYLLNQTDNFITPCFICRQALSDYCSNDLEIISFNNKGQSKSYLLGDLCPNSFGEGDLK